MSPQDFPIRAGPSIGWCMGQLQYMKHIDFKTSSNKVYSINLKSRPLCYKESCGSNEITTSIWIYKPKLKLQGLSSIISKKNP